MSIRLTNFTVISNTYARYELQDEKGNAKVIDRNIPAYLTACCKKVKDYQKWFTSAENYYARTGVALFNETRNPCPNQEYVEGDEYRHDRGLLVGFIEENKPIKKILRLSISILKKAYGDQINGIEAAAAKYIGLQRHFKVVPQKEIIKQLTDHYVSVASSKQIEVLETIFRFVSLEEYPTQATLKNILKQLTSISDLQEKTLECITEIEGKLGQIDTLQAQIDQKIEEVGEDNYQTAIDKLLCINSFRKEQLEHRESIEYYYQRHIDINVEPVRLEFYQDVTTYLATLQTDFTDRTDVHYPVIHEVLNKMYETLSKMFYEEVNQKADIHTLFEYYCERCVIIYRSHINGTGNPHEIQQKLTEIFEYVSTASKPVSKEPSAILLLQLRPFWEEFYSAISENPQLGPQFESYIGSYVGLLKLYNMNALDQEHLDAFRDYHVNTMSSLPLVIRLANHEKRIKDTSDGEGELIVHEQEKLLCVLLEMSNHDALVGSNELCNQLMLCPKEFKSLYGDFLEEYSHLQKEAHAVYHEGLDLASNMQKRKQLIAYYQEMHRVQTIIEEKLNHLIMLSKAQEPQQAIPHAALLELCKGMSFVLEHHDKIEHAKKVIKESSTNLDQVNLDNIFELDASDNDYYNSVNKAIKKLEKDLSDKGPAQDVKKGHAIETLHKLFDALYGIYFEEQAKHAKTYDIMRYYYAKSSLISSCEALDCINPNDVEWLKKVNELFLRIHKYMDATELLMNAYGQVYIQCKPLWNVFHEALKNTPALAIHFQSYIDTQNAMFKLYLSNAITTQHLEAMREHHTAVMHLIPFAKRIAEHEKKIADAMPSGIEMIVKEQERLFCTRLELANNADLAQEKEVLQLLENISKTYPEHYSLFLENYLTLQTEAQALLEANGNLLSNRNKRIKLVEDYQIVQGFQRSIDVEYNALGSYTTPNLEDLNYEVYRTHELAKGMARILKTRDIIQTIWTQRDKNFLSNYQYDNQSSHDYIYKFLEIDLTIDAYRHREGIQALIHETLVKIFNAQSEWYSQNNCEAFAIISSVSDYYEELGFLTELYNLDDEIAGHENFIATRAEPTTVGETSSFLMTKVLKREKIISKVYKQYALLESKNTLPSIAGITGLQANIDEKITQVTNARRQVVQKLVLFNKQLCELSVLQETYFAALMQFINTPGSLSIDTLIVKRQAVVAYLNTFSEKTAVQDTIIDLLFELDTELKSSFASAFVNTEQIIHFKFDTQNPSKSFSNEKHALIKNTELLDQSLKILPHFFKYHNLSPVQFIEVASYAAKTGAPYQESDPFWHVNTPLQVSLFYPYVQNIASAQAALWNTIEAMQDFEKAPTLAQINSVHQALASLKNVVDKAKRELPLQLEFSNHLRDLQFWYNHLFQETPQIDTDNPYIFFNKVYYAYLLRNEAFEEIFALLIKAFGVKKKLGTLKSPLFDPKFYTTVSQKGIELNRQARELIKKIWERDLTNTIQSLVNTVPEYSRIVEINLRLLPLLEPALFSDNIEVDWLKVNQTRDEYWSQYTNLLNRFNSPAVAAGVEANYTFKLPGTTEHMAKLALELVQQHFNRHTFVPLNINDKCTTGICTSTSLFNPTETQLLVRNHKEVFVVDAGKAAFQHVNNARTIVSQDGKHHVVFSFQNGSHAVNVLAGSKGSSVQVANRFITANYTPRQSTVLSLTPQHAEDKQEAASKLPWKDLPFRMGIDTANPKNLTFTASHSFEGTSVHAVSNTGAINQSAALVVHELENGSVSAVINPLKPLDSLLTATHKLKDLNTEVSIVASPGNPAQAALVTATSIGEGTKLISAIHPANPALSTVAIQQSLLNKNMQVALVATPANIRNASLNLSYDTQKFDAEGVPLKETNFMAGINIPVTDPSNATLTVGAKIYHSDGPGCKDASIPFVALNLKDPKRSSLGFVSTFGKTSVGIGLSPADMKNPAILAQRQFDVPNVGNLTVGGQLNLRKPLASSVSVQVPIPVYGVPVCVGVSAQLSRLDEARVTIGIYNQPLVSVKIKDAAKPIIQAHINGMKTIIHDVQKGLSQLPDYPLKGVGTLAVTLPHATTKAMSPVVNALARPIARAAGEDLHKVARLGKHAVKRAHRGLKKAGKKVKKAFRL